MIVTEKYMSEKMIILLVFFLTETKAVIIETNVYIVYYMIYFRSRNFREQKLSRAEKFAKFLHFASINFRESAKIEFFAS